MIKLYNSLSHKKEAFEPIQASAVSMYSCGPTVYDKIHIGNLRAFITADLLQRTLRHVEGMAVKWVMNITDIDDKIINRLERDYPGVDPETARAELTKKYTDVFLRDIGAVGINGQDIQIVSAVDSIADMQQLITELYQKNIAYIADGSVYFSIERYRDAGQVYGRLVNLEYDAEARVTDDQDQKEGVADFALWKSQKPGEPAWEFMLDGQKLPGRPGWHIECSAMSSVALGLPFDIHTGGIDLKFPHHENEIAQSGGKLANYFVHNEFLNVNSQKMSKSLNNFATLSDVSDPRALRLLCLQAHYRSQLDFTDESMQAAHNRLIALRQAVRKNQYASESQVTLQVGSTVAQAFMQNFASALADDLNTPLALSALAEYEREAAMHHGFVESLTWADQVLGLGLVDEVIPFTQEEAALISERNAARQKGDFEVSDKIRDGLKIRNIDVDDLSGSSLYWRM